MTNFLLFSMPKQFALKLVMNIQQVQAKYNNFRSIWTRTNFRQFHWTLNIDNRDSEFIAKAFKSLNVLLVVDFYNYLMHLLFLFQICIRNSGCHPHFLGCPNVAGKPLNYAKGPRYVYLSLTRIYYYIWKSNVYDTVAFDYIRWEIHNPFSMYLLFSNDEFIS